MRIETAAVEVGDVVLDDEGTCWRLDARETGRADNDIAMWSTFGMPGGSMGGAALPAPAGDEVTLLVHNGKPVTQ
jgi:hypothetical protein